MTGDITVITIIIIQQVPEYLVCVCQKSTLFIREFVSDFWVLLMMFDF